MILFNKTQKEQRSVALVHFAIQIAILVGLLAPSAGTQDIAAARANALRQKLAKDGFENVRVHSNDSMTLVAFENSGYRYNAGGVINAYAHSVKGLPLSTDKMFFIVLKYNVPLTTFESADFRTLTTQDKQQTVRLPQLAISNNETAVVALLRKSSAYYPSRFKTDVIIHPDIRMKIGEYDNPIAAQINVMPEFRIQLAAGLYASASILFPLYNELEQWGDYIRLGPSSLNFFTRLGSHSFFYAAGGYFKDQRYGAQVGLLKYVLSGRLMLDARIGASGYGLMDQGRYKYSDIDALTFSATATYFAPAMQLFFSIGAHRFIYEDHGLRLQVYRFFHDFRFGFWSTYADSEFNGGFQFSLPLPPKRYRLRKSVRIRPASYFNWTYQAKRNTINGRQLRANEQTDEMFIQYNPSYISTKLSFFE